MGHNAKCPRAASTAGPTRLAATTMCPTRPATVQGGHGLGRSRSAAVSPATTVVRARLQDLVQPAWTWIAGGCHPNRNTERNVEAAGFRIEEEGRRARNDLRRFQARPR